MNFIRGRYPRQDWRQPKNLCRYFWFVVGSTVGFPVAVVLGTILLAIMVAVLFPIWWVYDRYKEHRLVVAQAKELRQAAREGRPPRVIERAPPVVLAFFKARKKRLCPMIQVVD